MQEEYTQVYDVIVIGSGAGGATVAREMAKKDYKVAVFEWGEDNTPNRGLFTSPFVFFGGTKHRKDAFLRSRGTPKIDIVRAITTGGSTMIYGGVSWDPPYNLFKRYGIDLEEEVNEIKNEICVKCLEDNQIGTGGKIISDAAIKLGLKWEKISRFFIDSNKFKQTSYLFGDKTGARWDARVWIKEVQGKSLFLYNNSFCKKVIIDSNKAIGVIIENSKKEEKEFHGRIIIISAGGIGSSVILKNSNINCGEGIFVDPYVVAFGYIDYANIYTEVTRQSGILIDEKISIGDSILPPPAYMKMIASNKKFKKLFNKKRCLSLLIEIDDEVNGIIDEHGNIIKSLSESDIEKLDKGKEIAKSILKTAGANDIWFSNIAGVHPGGACRVGTVVDSDLATDIENLYVCDASVLPESMAIPPAMSIMCLGKRLAKHLSQKYKKI